MSGLLSLHTLVERFHLWNFLGLLLLGILFRVYGTAPGLIAWPVSDLLSVLLLSTWTFHLRSQIRGLLRLFLIAIAFAVSHWLLKGLLEILLTRFFRLEEQFYLLAFDEYLISHVTLLVDGLLWFGFYMILFGWLRTQVQMHALQETNRNLEKELKKVDLKALNNEMSPHFLFNAMNGVAMKVRMQENTLAVKMIAALTDLLRLSLGKHRHQQITIAEEIELLNKYLLIEQTRFGEHFDIQQHFSEALMAFRVPRLILQPLVENAFKHGMNQQLEQLTVKVEGHTEGERLVLSVFNSRLDQRTINFVNSNIGLPNIVYRLRRFYGTDFQFQSYSAQDGVVFRITIPQVL